MSCDEVMSNPSLSNSSFLTRGRAPSPGLAQAQAPLPVGRDQHQREVHFVASSPPYFPVSHTPVPHVLHPREGVLDHGPHSRDHPVQSLQQRRQRRLPLPPLEDHCARHAPCIQRRFAFLTVDEVAAVRRRAREALLLHNPAAIGGDVPLVPVVGLAVLLGERGLGIARSRAVRTLAAAVLLDDGGVHQRAVLDEKPLCFKVFQRGIEEGAVEIRLTQAGNEKTRWQRCHRAWDDR